MIKVSSYLSPKRVQIVEAETKNNAILQSLEMFRDCNDIINFDNFCVDILNRESLLPTGIGLGIGVPHVKNSNIREPVSGLSVLKNPIEYGSMDGVKVNIIIVVGMPQGAETLYLQYLSKISIRFSSEQIRNSITSCQDTEELIKAIQII